MNFLTIGKWKLNIRTIIKMGFVLFIIGIMIGVNIAFREDTGDNLPIPILMIFFIPITFIFYKPILKIIKINS